MNFLLGPGVNIARVAAEAFAHFARQLHIPACGERHTGRVAQVYVSDPSATVERPERELKGFAKVRLNPGQTQHVTVSLDARAFSYWSESAHKWTIDPGKFVIRVGDSSENTPLTTDLLLK